MTGDSALGRYCNTDSLLHRTDPRVKIILYVFYLVAIFMLSNPISLLMLAAVTLLLIYLGNTGLKVIWLTVKPILLLVVFITVINIFTIRAGKPLFSWQFITVTEDGLKTGILMGTRLIFLIIITSIYLTLTTTPLKISDSLESLFSWMKVFRFPVHEMSMMMSIALRFIPTLSDETRKIMNAQMSRGADYDTGGVIKRIKGYITVLVPLFVSSFNRAEDLATAMDARCYRGGEGRTKLNPLRLKGSDVATGIILALVAAGMVAADRLLG
ncbi:MAG: energy-coupling factor transporter transmembrane protein EcfT [Clostridiales bacterium]|nr:energy-coupling factor transporter transmembrane protein EcfT [Clostridiales bacterium]